MDGRGMALDVFHIDDMADSFESYWTVLFAGTDFVEKGIV